MFKASGQDNMKIIEPNNIFQHYGRALRETFGVGGLNCTDRYNRQSNEHITFLMYCKLFLCRVNHVEMDSTL